jgi:NAD(P)-dependent dehydrogenase (short-subunit alcohol dehydrogenase family)/acyl carrier protein
VARWLAGHGARYLLLVGRGGPTPAAHQVLRELEREGVQVHVEHADVSQREQVSRVLAAMATMPPLRGVMHTAGVLDDGVLLQQDEKRFANVMAPKVEGAWNLHVLTRQTPLDFFVMFSSIASLLGTAGQGNYAAANAFLDALAHLRRAQNLPAVSVNWGPWAKAGMAASLGLEGERKFADRGIELMLPEQGLQVLGEILAANPIQVAVVPIDWERYLHSSQNGHQPSLLRTLSDASRPAKHHDADLAPLQARQSEPLPESSADQFRERVRLQVQEHAVRVLGLNSSQPLDGQRPLTDLGLDSLMAVELVNAIAKSTGFRLPSDLVFDRPTVDGLTGYLTGQMQAESRRTKPAMSTSLPPVQLPPAPAPSLLKMLRTSILGSRR